MLRWSPLLAFVFCAATNAFAQTKADSLLSVGFKYLDSYAETHDLGDARNAHRAFTKVLDKDPNNSQAHLGLGLAYTAVEGQQLDPLGVNDATRVVNNTMAVRHLVAAMKGGADATRAAHAFVLVTRREYDTDRMQSAVKSLESVKSSNEIVQGAIAELYIAMYKPDRAEAAVANATTVSGTRIRAIAQLLQPAKVDAGGNSYLSALANADSSSIQEFVRDARWLPDPAEDSAWMHLDATALRNRLAQFWQRRATKAGVSVPERLATHFTRVQHAMQEFSYYRQHVAPRGALTVGPSIDSRYYDVDDRAFTYVRYGEPDERIVTLDTVAQDGRARPVSAPPTRGGYNPAMRVGGDPTKGNVAFPTNQTWVYRHLSDHPVAFDFFLPPADPHGWTLVAEMVSCVGGTMPFSEGYLRDRMSVDPRYGLLLANCSGKSVPPDPSRVFAVTKPFENERREFLQKAAVQDNAVPHTKKNVPLMADVLQFAGERGNTEVTAVITWPLHELSNKNGIVSTHLSLMIADTLSGRTIRRDTVVNVRLPAGAPAASARVYLKTDAPAGNGRFFRIGLRDMNDDSVVTIVGDTIDVRKMTDAQLAISDVALVSGEGGSWSRNGRRFSLLPRGSAVRSFSIYYEAYGIAPHASYTTTMTFEPQDEGLAAIIKKLKGSQNVSFKFEGSNETNENVVRELRAMQSELPAGRYRLTVNVSSGAQSASSFRMIMLPK